LHAFAVPDPPDPGEAFLDGRQDSASEEVQVLAIENEAIASAKAVCKYSIAVGRSVGRGKNLLSFENSMDEKEGTRIFVVGTYSKPAHGIASSAPKMSS